MAGEFDRHHLYRPFYPALFIWLSHLINSSFSMIRFNTVTSLILNINSNYNMWFKYEFVCVCLNKNFNCKNCRSNKHWQSFNYVSQINANIFVTDCSLFGWWRCCLDFSGNVLYSASECIYFTLKGNRENTFNNNQGEEDCGSGTKHIQIFALCSVLNYIQSFPFRISFLPHFLSLWEYFHCFRGQPLNSDSALSSCLGSV